MARTILPPFASFSEEGVIIGRLLAGYGELEIDLAMLAGEIVGDTGMALRVLYRARGEAQRVNLADALARRKIKNEAMRCLFERTIAAMRQCTKIRNTFAHSNWVAGPNCLMFVTLEDMAARNHDLEEMYLTQHDTPKSLLDEQEAYFIWVQDTFAFIKENWRYGDDEQSSPASAAPIEMPMPPLHRKWVKPARGE